MGVPYVMFKILGCSKMFYGRPDPIQIQLFIFKNEYDPAFGHQMSIDTIFGEDRWYGESLSKSHLNLR